jgi:hypothetical protein
MFIRCVIPAINGLPNAYAGFKIGFDRFELQWSGVGF